MQNKEISVIIPVYNSAKYLPDCLDSVLGQKNANFEIVLVDDSSTDTSLAICEKYAAREKNIKIIKLPQNSGPGYARNRGFDNAQGEYVIFLDSDDFFDPSLLEKMSGKIKNTGSDICICRAYNWLYAKDWAKEIDFETQKDLLPDFDGFNAQTCPDYIFNICHGWPWDKMYKKDFLQTNNIRFPESRTVDGAEDLVFVFDTFAKAGKIAILNEFLVYHRRYGDSLESRRKINSGYTALQMLRQRLISAGKYEMLAQSFHNCAFQHLSWHRRHLKKLGNPVPCRMFGQWLKDLDMLDKPVTYFYNRDLYINTLKEEAKIRFRNGLLSSLPANYSELTFQHIMENRIPRKDKLSIISRHIVQRLASMQRLLP